MHAPVQHSMVASLYRSQVLLVCPFCPRNLVSPKIHFRSLTCPLLVVLHPSPHVPSLSPTSFPRRTYSPKISSARLINQDTHLRRGLNNAALVKCEQLSRRAGGIPLHMRSPAPPRQATRRTGEQACSGREAAGLRQERDAYLSRGTTLQA